MHSFVLNEADWKDSACVHYEATFLVMSIALLTVPLLVSLLNCQGQTLDAGSYQREARLSRLETPDIMAK